MKSTFFYTLLVCLLALSACKKGDKMPPIDNAIDLDGTIINDSSLIYPTHFLLSAAKHSPTPLELNTPVVIAVHGFSATTFEWIEFRDFASNSGSFLTSLILLGGHGRDYEDFKNASWEDWQQPIIDEYTKLRNLGYKKINIVASSTGCPLVLDMVHNSKINADKLTHIFLIDPIVVPSNKTLSLINAVGKSLSYSESTMEKGENGYWYKYRPYQALQQLNDFTQHIRKQIEHKIILPQNVKLYVYKSKEDSTADPISAAMLLNGVFHADGSSINVEMINSNLHVFTRLKGRNSYFSEDIQIQQNTFNDIKNKL